MESRSTTPWTDPGSFFRRAIVAIGVACLCGTLVVAVGSAVGLAPPWPWRDDVLLVAFFTAAFTVAIALLPFGVWNIAEPSDPTRPAPERVPSTPVPGAALDRILECPWPTYVPRARRRELRRRVRTSVRRMIVRREGCTADEANRALERGTWTDDPAAAAFVRTAQSSRSSRLRGAFEWLWFSRRLRRTLEALDSYERREADRR